MEQKRFGSRSSGDVQRYVPPEEQTDSERKGLRSVMLISPRSETRATPALLTRIFACFACQGAGKNLKGIVRTPFRSAWTILRP